MPGRFGEEAEINRLWWEDGRERIEAEIRKQMMEKRGEKSSFSVRYMQNISVKTSYWHSLTNDFSS